MPQEVHDSKVFGPKNSFRKMSTPTQPIIGNMHTSSTSYYPQKPNRLSSLSNKLSEVSEVVEETQDYGNNSFELNPYHNTQVVTTEVGQLNSTSLYNSEDQDDTKSVYNAKKLFVGGLPHGITEAEFRAYFSQYGELED